MGCTSSSNKANNIKVTRPAYDLEVKFDPTKFTSRNEADAVGEAKAVAIEGADAAGSGLLLSWVDSGLKVDSISSGGSVDEYNKANPDLQIGVGDVICSINDRWGDEKSMRNELEKKTMLTLQVKRAAALVVVGTAVGESKVEAKVNTEASDIAAAPLEATAETQIDKPITSEVPTLEADAKPTEKAEANAGEPASPEPSTAISQGVEKDGEQTAPQNSETPPTTSPDLPAIVESPASTRQLEQPTAKELPEAAAANTELLMDKTGDIVDVEPVFDEPEGAATKCVICSF